MRKIIVLLLLIVVLFSSCSGEKTELKNRVVIEGIGVDTEKDEYVLTIQTLNLTQSSGGSDSSSPAQVVNYTVSGKTVEDAMEKLSRTTGKNPLYSQNRLIVLGNELDSDAVSKALDWFVREYTSRSDVSVACASGKASDILLNEYDSGEICAKVIEESIEQSNDSSIAGNAMVYNLVNLLRENTTNFTLPLLEISEDKNSKSTTVKVTGTKVYGGDGENRMSEDETMYFLLATDMANRGSFYSVVDGIKTSYDIISTKTKIKTMTENGKPKVEIHVKCTVDVIEYGNKDFGSISIDTLGKMALSAESRINTGIGNILNRQLKDEKCDIFRFGKRFMLSDTDYYEKVYKNWKKELPEIETAVYSKVTIKRVGQENLKPKTA